jgi:hypothetical protein
VDEPCGSPTQACDYSSTAPSDGSSADSTFEMLMAWISAILCLNVTPSTSSRYFSLPSRVTSCPFWRFRANFERCPAAWAPHQTRRCPPVQLVLHAGERRQRRTLAAARLPLRAWPAGGECGRTRGRAGDAAIRIDRGAGPSRPVPHPC